MTFEIKIIRVTFILMFFASFYAQAGGISVDAGLTPGQDRWMLRTQYRFMKMQNTTMEIQNHIVPMVIAYGVSSNFTLMARVMYVNRINSMNNAIKKRGFNDAYILLKFKVYRENTANYVLGIAPYFASNIPVGNPDISEKTWNPELGLSMSYRPRFWSIDFASSYTLKDVLNKTEDQESDNLSLNVAFSSIIPLENSNIAISPVFELTFNKELDTNVHESKNPEVLFLSPGLKFIKSSIVFEVLYQNPIYQQTNESLMKSKSRILIGLRYMF